MFYQDRLIIGPFGVAIHYANRYTAKENFGKGIVEKNAAKMLTENRRDWHTSPILRIELLQNLEYANAFQRVLR